MIPIFAIVGGGAAGMCAAIRARLIQAEHFPKKPLRIIIFERNARLGIKIRISGGGKCNITHEGEMMTILKDGFHRINEQRFLKPSFFEFTNNDVLEWLHAHHVPTYTRDNGRVFPTSGNADDVLHAFELLLNEHQIEVQTSARILSLDFKSSTFSLTIDSNGLVKEFKAEAVLLATGGVSYTKTGTTGDGIKFAKKFGHSIQEPLAALAPIYFEKKPKHDWIGVSLRSVGLIARTSNTALKASGDVLITHLGISGPACLSLSRSVAELIHSMNHNSTLTAPEKITNIFIDFMESKSAEEIEKDFLTYASQFSTQQVKTHISTLLPNALIEDFFSQSSVPIDIKWNSLSKVSRKKIVTVLKSFSLGSVREVPIEKGEVSAGGVSLKEVDSKTMQSRIVKKLFFAGEILDIAGEVGGYNLQAAYSTGWVAGEHAAFQLLEDSE